MSDLLEVKHMRYIIFLFLLLSFHAKAMYFSSYIYEMGSKEDFISKYVTNDTDTSNLYNINAYPIEKPSNTNEIRLNINDKEVLYTPLRQTINKKETDIFKIIYRGPKDDKERYYRVVFTEIPLTSFSNQDKNRSSTYIPSTSLSTILIVRPRKPDFQYILDEKQGYIKNTGNTFFRVVIHSGCNGRDDNADQFYMLPGEEYHNISISTDNRKLLIFDKRYIPVGDKCSQVSFDQSES